MDIKDLVDAAIQALVNNDTRSIKEILRQDSHADYIFASVTDGCAVLSVRDLFLRVNASLPEIFRNGHFLYPNYDDTLDNVLLHHAVYISDCELIRLLIEKGADVTSTDLRMKTALHIACAKASLGIIKFLVEKSPAHILHLPSQYGSTPLDYACLYNCPDVVQFLLSRGSSVGANEDGRFPVYYAVCNDVAEYATPMVSLLLDAGANMNLPTWETPLMLAIEKAGDETLASTSITSQNSPYVDLCMRLIDRGCDVNAADVCGKTALHFAVIEQLESIVRKLLIFGSDIERRDNFGHTALHYACMKGNQRLTDLLIISGANLRAVDWETTQKQWRSWEILDERNTQLLNYVSHVSKQGLSLKDLCYIVIRNNIRNVERDASQLGLPPLLVRRLQLKD